jgi:hypothetical protein
VSWLSDSDVHGTYTGPSGWTTQTLISPSVVANGEYFCVFWSFWDKFERAIKQARAAP